MVLGQLLHLCFSALLTSGFPSVDTAVKVLRSQDTKGMLTNKVFVETDHIEGPLRFVKFKLKNLKLP